MSLVPWNLGVRTRSSTSFCLRGCSLGPGWSLPSCDLLLGNTEVGGPGGRPPSPFIILRDPYFPRRWMTPSRKAQSSMQPGLTLCKQEPVRDDGGCEHGPRSLLRYACRKPGDWSGSLLQGERSPLHFLLEQIPGDSDHPSWRWSASSPGPSFLSLSHSTDPGPVMVPLPKVSAPAWREAEGWWGVTREGRGGGAQERGQGVFPQKTPEPFTLRLSLAAQSLMGAAPSLLADPDSLPGSLLTWSNNCQRGSGSSSWENNRVTLARQASPAESDTAH